MSYAHRIESGKKVRLKDIDPDANGGLDKEEGKAAIHPLLEELSTLQEELYAAGSHSVLVVLQGMDTSGKDGTIRGVFGGVNPQGCQVESFKVPTEEELAHDFLWRVHKATPGKALIGIFNRSHYEDVLVVRVHDIVPKDVWKPRYEHINNFEQLLANSRTIIIKCFLHISKDEQEARLLDREKEVEKAWKLSAGDWKERQYWDDYQEAYEDALSACSTDTAPWHVIPANRKWFRNLAVAELLVETLRPYRKEWQHKLQEMSKERLAELSAYREETKS